MVQSGRGPGFAPEPLQSLRIEQRLGREQFEGDVAPEGLLDGLVHDPHPAVPDSADDAELTHPHWVGQLGRGREHPGVLAGGGFEVFHLHQRREQLPDRIGEFRVAVGVLSEGRALTGAEPGDELLGEPVERVAVGGRFGHERVLPCGGGCGYKCTCAPTRTVHRNSPGIQLDVSIALIAR